MRVHIRRTALVLMPLRPRHRVGGALIGLIRGSDYVMAHPVFSATSRAKGPVLVAQGFNPGGSSGIPGAIRSAKTPLFASDARA